jgi:hypothetical protein
MANFEDIDGDGGRQQLARMKQASGMGHHDSTEETQTARQQKARQQDGKDSKKARQRESKISSYQDSETGKRQRTAIADSSQQKRNTTGQQATVDPK